MVLTPASSYAVDIMHSRSAEVVALMLYVVHLFICVMNIKLTSVCLSGLRGVFIASGIPWILPSINRFGVVWFDAGVAVLAWGGFGYVLNVLHLPFSEFMRLIGIRVWQVVVAHNQVWR